MVSLPTGEHWQPSVTPLPLRAWNGPREAWRRPRNGKRSRAQHTALDMSR